jgi:hypothetical protein
MTAGLTLARKGPGTLPPKEQNPFQAGLLTPIIPLEAYEHFMYPILFQDAFSGGPICIPRKYTRQDSKPLRLAHEIYRSKSLSVPDRLCFLAHCLLRSFNLFPECVHIRQLGFAAVQYFPE